MKRTLFILALLCTANAYAQLYKWTGADGKINYSDTPPPATARMVEKKLIDTGGGSTDSFPFDLAEATKNNPVIFYTTDKCLPCDDARAFLKTRGIPFMEKTVSSNEDMKKLRQASNANSLPTLMIGRNSHVGFEAGSWGSALTGAGYPEVNKLPPTYRYAQAEAAAPAPKPVEKPAAEALAIERKNTPATPPKNAPEGFQF